MDYLIWNCGRKTDDKDTTIFNPPKFRRGIYIKKIVNVLWKDSYSMYIDYLRPLLKA